MRKLGTALLVGAPANLEPSRRGTASASLAVSLDEFACGAGVDITVGDPRGKVGCVRAESAHVNRRRLVGTGVDTRILDRVVPPPARDLVALPQQSHELDRFFEH